MEKEKFHFTYTLPCKIICFLLFAALAGDFMTAVFSMASSGATIMT